MELIVGECRGKMRSMPTPKLTRRTVKVALEARPFFEITTPSKAWRRSFSFSPSPSLRRTFTRMVSPGRNSGRSLRSCASCNLRIAGFMFVLPFRPTQAGPADSRVNANYSQVFAIYLVHFPNSNSLSFDGDTAVTGSAFQPIFLAAHSRRQG